MITYTGISNDNLRDKVFLIPFASLQANTSTTLSITTNGYVCPVSFLVFNKTNDTIDKVLFKDTYLGNNFSHECNILSDKLYLVGMFNQGPPPPAYNPNSYSSSQILVQWSNLGHTYTQGGLYIKVIYYISTKFW